MCDPAPEQHSPPPNNSNVQVRLIPFLLGSKRRARLSLLQGDDKDQDGNGGGPFIRVERERKRSVLKKISWCWRQKKEEDKGEVDRKAGDDDEEDETGWLKCDIPLDNVLSVEPWRPSPAAGGGGINRRKEEQRKIFSSRGGGGASGSTSNSSSVARENSTYNRIPTNSNGPVDGIIIHYMELDPSKFGRGGVPRRKWLVKHLCLRYSNGNNSSSKGDTGPFLDCAKALSSACCRRHRSSGRPRRLLVLVNPYGGTGKGVQTFQGTVAPVFRAAGVEFEVLTTARAGHAAEVLSYAPVQELEERFDGVVSVGGDGVFNEVVSGMLRRAAGAAGVDVDRDEDAPLPCPSLPVGVIPAGSTDTASLCVHGTADVLTAALIIVRGHRRRLDVSSIRSGAGDLRHFSMTMVSYGYFGDLMRRSERYRWLGPYRYDVSGLHTFLANRGYKGQITFSKDKGSKSDPTVLDTCNRKCQTCYVEDSSNAPLSGDIRENSQRTPATEEENCEWREVQKAEESELERIAISGKFSVVTGACLPCRCRHTPSGVAPSAHLGDGCVDLILVRWRPSRLQYLRYLFLTAKPTGNPFTLPHVDVYRVREFSFRHDSAEESSGRKSVWNCDGEVVDLPEIRVKVHRRLVEVFGVGIEPEGEEDSKPINKSRTLVTILEDGSGSSNDEHS